MRTGILRAAPFVLILLIGALLALVSMAWQEAAEATAKLEKTQADARAAWGKVYDMQEQGNDEADAARLSASLEVYEIQTQLDACLKTSGADAKGK